jgi:hypothetical protein
MAAEKLQPSGYRALAEVLFLHQMAISENRALKDQSIAPVPDAANISTSLDGRGLP